MKNHPKIFISYSHKPSENKLWVIELAKKLRENGVDTVLDYWDLRPGQDFILFMEEHIYSCDFVIMVINEIYHEKTEKPKGGVGYERMLISSQLVKNMGIEKFIPIIRQENGMINLPRFIETKLALNFSNENEFDNNFDELLRKIYGIDSSKKPPLGKNPFPTNKEKKKAVLSANALAVFKAFIIEYNNGNKYVRDNELEIIQESSKLNKVRFNRGKVELYQKELIDWSDADDKYNWEQYSLTSKGLNLAIELKLT